MDLGLKDKVCIVTGASKGIGRAIAEEFAREGVRLVISARSEDLLKETTRELMEKYRAMVMYIPADLTRPHEIKKISEKTVEMFGRIDILVNNTGGPPAGFFQNLSDEDWLSAFELSVMSVIRMCREVIPVMKQNRWGRIINMVSVSVKTPIPNLILSNTLRGAIPGFTKTMADYLARYDILINNLCPGYTATERVDSLAQNIAGTKGITPQQVKETWAEAIPLSRLASPAEIAPWAVFLASERASYITGQTITIDGGYHRGVV